MAYNKMDGQLRPRFLMRKELGFAHLFFTFVSGPEPAIRVLIRDGSMLCFSLLKLLENCFVLFLAWVFLRIIPICASIHHLFVLPKSPQDMGFTGLTLGGP